MNWIIDNLYLILLTSCIVGLIFLWWYEKKSIKRKTEQYKNYLANQVDNNKLIPPIVEKVLSQMNSLVKPLTPIYNLFSFKKEKFEVEVKWDYDYYPYWVRGRHLERYSTIIFKVMDNKGKSSFNFTISKFHPLYSKIEQVNREVIKKYNEKEKQNMNNLIERVTK